MNYGFVKVASAVPSVKVADCRYNILQIESLIAQAEGKGIEVICFPELSITAYTCGDLFSQQLLLDEAEMALISLLDFTRSLNIISIVGFPLPYRGTLLLPDGWQAMQNLPDSALLTVTPYVPAAGWHYASLRRSNALLEDADGHPIIFHLPEGYFACLNIGEEAVMNAFAEQLTTTLPAGKGALLWFDSGQILFRIGNPALRKAFARNWHTLAERFGAVIRRSAYGTPTQWRPFAVSPADLSDGTMRQTLTRILNLGLSGCIYPFMTFTDSNGGIRDEGALLRATQLAAFLPISVIPTDTTRFADDANRRALQRTLTLRKEMNDYVEGLLRESLTTREPIIRLMEYQYPGQGFADCTDQFMLGPDCLVAPLLDGEPQRLVRLPRGAWTAADGTKYRGPRVIRVDVSDGCMPVFFRR